MQDADRDEFERAAERNGYRLMRRAGSADYASPLTQAAWEGYLMRMNRVQ